MRKTELVVEGLNAYRAVDKLAGAGIPVYSVRKTQKNAVTLSVNGKDIKKVFAILNGSCYNVKKVRYRGWLLLRDRAARSAGLLAGAAAFLIFVICFQSRILAVRIVGSGAYYDAEVRQILTEEGAGRFLSVVRDPSAVTVRILSLPRVSFCSLKTEGGVLTVTVEVSDENQTLSSEPLLSPVQGLVEELVVVRGTPLVQVGDTVQKNDTVVENRAVFGAETREVLVIARVKVSYPFSVEYTVEGEDRALAQAALDYGETKDVRAQKTADGWRVEGTAYAEAKLNF